MGAEGTVSGETVGLGREEPGAPESRVAAETGRSRGVDGRGEDREGDQHRPENRESLGIRNVLRYWRHVVEPKNFVWRCAITLTSTEASQCMERGITNDCCRRHLCRSLSTSSVCGRDGSVRAEGSSSRQIRGSRRKGHRDRGGRDNRRRAAISRKVVLNCCRERTGGHGIRVQSAIGCSTSQGIFAEIIFDDVVEVEVVGLLAGDLVTWHSFHWRKRACLIELLTSRVE